MAELSLAKLNEETLEEDNEKLKAELFLANGNEAKDDANDAKIDALEAANEQLKSELSLIMDIQEKACKYCMLLVPNKTTIVYLRFSVSILSTFLQLPSYHKMFCLGRYDKSSCICNNPKHFLAVYMITVKVCEKEGH